MGDFMRDNHLTSVIVTCKVDNDKEEESSI